MEICVPSPPNLLIQIAYFLLFLPYAIPAVSDYRALVYKNCATETLRGTLSETLDSLFTQLIAQSLHSSFFKTMEMGDDDTAMSGVFQCRQDISREECFRCVNLIPQMSETLCRHSVAARVQLEGCYGQYETQELNGWLTQDGDQLLHKVCEGEGEGFVNGKVMEEALEALESGIEKSKSGTGYYRGNYESVEMMAQCEGDLDACECGECVSGAIQVAEQQCSRASLSAHIYLNKCFISYIYHSNSSPAGGEVNKNSSSSSTKRLAAIVAGGAVAVCLALIFLFFLRSRYSKHDYY